LHLHIGFSVIKEEGNYVKSGTIRQEKTADAVKILPERKDRTKGNPPEHMVFIPFSRFDSKFYF
jgi:hypothetical protein